MWQILNSFFVKEEFLLVNDKSILTPRWKIRIKFHYALISIVLIFILLLEIFYSCLWTLIFWTVPHVQQCQSVGYTAPEFIKWKLIFLHELYFIQKLFRTFCVELFKKKLRNWLLATNSNFLILISLQPDEVDNGWLYS